MFTAEGSLVGPEAAGVGYSRPQASYVEGGSGYNKIVGGGSLHRKPMGQNGSP